MPRGWVLYWTVIIVGTILLVVVLAPPGMLEALGKLISAVSPIVTVGLAIFGVIVWRVQLVAKRHFEVAEEALSATLGAVDALAQVRHPGGWGNEGKSRKQGENETPEEKEKLDEAYIAYERAQRF